MKNKAKFAWCIAHLDLSTLDRLERDLFKSNQYQDIEAYIPTVRIIKKQFKGKHEFQDVPLYFNYGFFKIPLVWALNIDLLLRIRDDITCISHWVRDPARVHNSSLIEVPVATVTEKQIKQIKKTAQNYSVFSSEDLSNVKVGDEVELKGYPFEGMIGTVLDIDNRGKKVKLLINMDFIQREVTVSFENVFYSIYQGSHDEDYNVEKTLSDFQCTKLSEEE